MSPLINLHFNIRDKLWREAFPDDESFTEEKAEKVDREVLQYYNQFLKAGFTPNDTDIQYFLNNHM